MTAAVRWVRGSPGINEGRPTWELVCAPCGISEPYDEEWRAKQFAKLHNDQVHRGT